MELYLYHAYVKEPTLHEVNVLCICTIQHVHIEMFYRIL
jgi:hypothetical protein